MKTLCAVLVVVTLAACGKDSKEADPAPAPAPAPTAPTEPAPTAPAPTPTAPSPTAPAPSPTAPAPAPAAPVSLGKYDLPCEAEIVTHCPAGSKWGCEGGLTLTHACIPEKSLPGPDCTTKVLLQCPAGQMDGCLLQPAISTKHICVYDPAAAARPAAPAAPATP